MLQSLLGSLGAEKVLIFLAARGEGYAREISRSSGMGLFPIQKQLDRLEQGGILVSQLRGRTRLYSFNPAYPLLEELKQILVKALSLYPPAEREQLLISRQLPQAAPAVPAERLRRMSQSELAAYIRERLLQQESS